jgi:hypothetical protein
MRRLLLILVSLLLVSGPALAKKSHHRTHHKKHRHHSRHRKHH